MLAVGFSKHAVGTTASDELLRFHGLHKAVNEAIIFAPGRSFLPQPTISTELIKLVLVTHSDRNASSLLRQDQTNDGKDQLLCRMQDIWHSQGRVRRTEVANLFRKILPILKITDPLCVSKFPRWHLAEPLLEASKYGVNYITRDSTPLQQMLPQARGLHGGFLGCRPRTGTLRSLGIFYVAFSVC